MGAACTTIEASVVVFYIIICSDTLMSQTSYCKACCKLQLSRLLKERQPLSDCSSFMVLLQKKIFFFVFQDKRDETKCRFIIIIQSWLCLATQHYSELKLVQAQNDEGERMEKKLWGTIREEKIRLELLAHYQSHPT